MFRGMVSTRFIVKSATIASNYRFSARKGLSNPDTLAKCMPILAPANLTNMKYLPVFLIWALCSCQSIHRKLFSSTQINNPSLQKKGDHSFSAAYSSPSGFDFSGGFALTNRLALIGGAYTHKNNDTEEETSIFSNPDEDASAKLLYSNKGWHGGLGTYFPLSKKTGENFLSFFAGYTTGNFRMDERYYQDNAPSATRVSFFKSTIRRYFLQGSFSEYTKHSEFSLTCRYNNVIYSDIITDYTPDQQYNFSFPPLGYSRYSQFLDFGFTGKFFLPDSPWMGFQVFGSFTTRLNRQESNFYYYPFRAGFGLVVRNPFRGK